MKFILTMYVCSFMDFTCAPGITYPEVFNSWHQCSLKALTETQDLIISLPQDVVEKNRLATKYTCEQLSDA